ncbi:hypothetical protein [Spiroplasma turonicum]|uniref:Transmembrane protein n=1 Tax=Spiroplasma turonicum TaxID=216946 RepID=A0A0K1P7I6_9MOLU|nr:hypothetical protein [Spiroplasma turonicum]AKU80149.1 hypothetical protein STURON_00903 [Spiroplasma turonicum]ALX71149.1 hypothetical protein STURO_v1c08980 [Spiroplasma turonicum]
MKKIKNAYSVLVDKLLSTKSDKSKKIKKIILFSIMSTILLLSILTTLLLTIKSNTNYYDVYKFNNIIFKNETEVKNYAYNNSIIENYNYKTKSYILDNKIYQNTSKLNNEILKKFNINKKNTLRNPSNYTINSEGELSSSVVTSENELQKNVYRGKNGSAYLAKEEALNTYENSYNISYKVDGKEFDNLFSAQSYYKGTIEEELKNSTNAKKDCYLQDNLCTTKDDIKSWLRDYIKSGFEYNGNEFSYYNLSEYNLATTKIDDNLINKNIKSIANANKSAYWITQPKTDIYGFYTGPKYVETSENLASLKFEKNESYDVNAFLTPLSLVAGIEMFNLIYKFIFNNEKDKDYNLQKYLNYLNVEFKIDTEKFDKVVSLFNDPIIDDFSVGLDNIENNDLSQFHKFLISLKRLLNRNKVFPIESYNNLELEKIIKELVVNVLKTKPDVVETLFKDIDGGIDSLLDEDISFDYIYSLFINTQTFYTHNTISNKIFKLSKNILGIIDSIMDGISGISDLLGSINELKTNKEKNNDKLSKINSQNEFKAASLLQDNLGFVLKSFGEKSDNLNTKSHVQGRVAPLLVLELISKVWNLGKIFSFVSLNTYEAKIDSYQSLFYNTIVYKMPIFGFEFNSPKFNNQIIKLFNAPLDYMKSNDDQETTKVWEYKGKYYIDKNNAIEDLKRDMYKNPEYYVETRKLLTSGIDNSFYYLNLKPVCQTNNVDDSCISRSKYDIKVSESRELFIEDLFNKFYEKNKKQYYLDGFGDYFETREAALNSLDKKVNNESNYNKLYYYNTENGKKIYSNSLESIKGLIKQNELVDNKLVISSDLFTTMIYDELKEIDNFKYDIYELKFYGKFLYFLTYLQAWKYLKNHLQVEEIQNDNSTHVYTFEDEQFINELDFNNWIKDSTEVLRMWN